MLLAVNWAVAGPTVAAIIGALGAYLAAARRMSGKIETSDAEDLWAESRSIREDYRARLAELRARVTKLEEINAQLREENYELRKRLNGLNKETT